MPCGLPAVRRWADQAMLPVASSVASANPLWQSFLAVHRRIAEQLAEEMLAEHQLPLEWFDLLVHLADLPGMRARQKELRDLSL